MESWRQDNRAAMAVSLCSNPVGFKLQRFVHYIAAIEKSFLGAFCRPVTDVEGQALTSLKDAWLVDYEGWHGLQNRPPSP